MSEKEDNIDDMQSILEAIKSVLPCEVIWSAMHALKANPKLTITEAITYGFNEWIK